MSQPVSKHFFKSASAGRKGVYVVSSGLARVDWGSASLLDVDRQHSELCVELRVLDSQRPTAGPVDGIVCNEQKDSALSSNVLVPSFPIIRNRTYTTKADRVRLERKSLEVS